jgi:hypothetical protein
MSLIDYVYITKGTYAYRGLGNAQWGVPNAQNHLWDASKSDLRVPWGVPERSMISPRCVPIVSTSRDLQKRGYWREYSLISTNCDVLSRPFWIVEFFWFFLLSDTEEFRIDVLYFCVFFVRCRLFLRLKSPLPSNILLKWIYQSNRMTIVLIILNFQFKKSKTWWGFHPKTVEVSTFSGLFSDVLLKNHIFGKYF